jgi:hypothetical protein
VLNGAKWNSLAGAKILLGLLMQILPASLPILIVVDDTIERRSGKKIKAKGCYRDAWIATDLVQPWRDTIVTWYGGETKQVRMLSGISFWYSPGEKPLLIRWVLVSDPNKNHTEAFFSTDINLEPEKIVNYFVLRWNIEVTFFETRAHLGVETQRQWSDKAIARSTPMLMSLFSLICLFAIEMLKSKSLPILSSTWYDKKGEATFADILALVRRDILASRNFNDSSFESDYVKIRPDDWEALLNQLARAAWLAKVQSYRAIDKEGSLVNVYLSDVRDQAAAEAFSAKLKSRAGCRSVIASKYQDFKNICLLAA